MFADGDEEEVEGLLHGRCGEAAKMVQFEDIQTSTLQHVRIVSPFAAAHVEGKLRSKKSMGKTRDTYIARKCQEVSPSI